MTEQFLTQWQNWIFAVALATARIGAAFTVIPFLGTQVIPGMARNALILCWSIVVIPMIADEIAARPFDTLLFFGVILKEIFIGALIGFMISALIWAVESAGFFIDNQRGASIASSLDPLSGNESSPLGLLFTQMLAVFFFSSGAFLLFLGGLYHSYVLWPVFSFFPTFPDSFPIFVLGILDEIVRLAAVLAGPIIVSMFLAELGLAFISRFAPQLQVFFLAMPVKSGIAMFLLILYTIFLIHYIREDFGNVEILLRPLEDALR